MATRTQPLTKTQEARIAGAVKRGADRVWSAMVAEPNMTPAELDDSLGCVSYDLARSLFPESEFTSPRRAEQWFEWRTRVEIGIVEELSRRVDRGDFVSRLADTPAGHASALRDGSHASAHSIVKSH